MVDHKYRFTNVVAKWPGSDHDSFCLQQSYVYDDFENERYTGIVLGIVVLRNYLLSFKKAALRKIVDG